MAKKRVNAYWIDFHRRGDKRTSGRLLVEATTAEFAEKLLRRSRPGIVIDKTKLRYAGSIS